MNDKNELNDILISESNPKLISPKKILVLGAAGTVLFLVTIFVVFLVSRSGDSKTPPQQKQSQQTEIASNALKPIEPQSLPSDQLPKEPVFEEIKLKEEQPKTDKTDKIEKALQEIKERNKQEAMTKQTQNTSSSQASQIAQKEPEKTQTKEVQTKAQKSDIKQDFHNISTPNITASKQENSEVPKGYYVQVGAFFKFNPDKKFLDTLKNNNYQYHMLKTKSGNNDVVKVLIGPFVDEIEAKRALQKIREQINSSAFITRY